MITGILVGWVFSKMRPSREDRSDPASGQKVESPGVRSSLICEVVGAVGSHQAFSDALPHEPFFVRPASLYDPLLSLAQPVS